MSQTNAAPQVTGEHHEARDETRSPAAAAPKKHASTLDAMARLVGNDQASIRKALEAAYALGRNEGMFEILALEAQRHLPKRAA